MFQQYINKSSNGKKDDFGSGEVRKASIASKEIDVKYKMGDLHRGSSNDP